MMVTKSFFKRVLGAHEGEGVIVSPPLTRFAARRGGVSDAEEHSSDGAGRLSSGEADNADPKPVQFSRFKKRHQRPKPKYLEDVTRSARSLSQHGAMFERNISQSHAASSAPPPVPRPAEIGTPDAMPTPPTSGVQTSVRSNIQAKQLSNEGADMIPVDVVMQAMARRLSN